jgi:hypothetical protein
MLHSTTGHEIIILLLLLVFLLLLLRYSCTQRCAAVQATAKEVPLLTRQFYIVLNNILNAYSKAVLLLKRTSLSACTWYKAPAMTWNWTLMKQQSISSGYITNCLYCTNNKIRKMLCTKNMNWWDNFKQWDSFRGASGRWNFSSDNAKFDLSYIIWGVKRSLSDL